MTIIGQYEELALGMGFKSMKEDFESGEYEEKEKIIDYLKNGHVHMVTASLVKDVFTGKQTDIEKIFMDDGSYSWCSSIIYYVDKYNLKLPKEFEEHILNSYDKIMPE